MSRMAATISVPAMSGRQLALLPCDYQPEMVRSEPSTPQDCESSLRLAIERPDALIERDGKLAIITIKGAMVFDYGIWNYLMGDVPIKQVCAAIREVAMDTLATDVLVRFNCPGGSVLGTSDIRSACDELVKSGKTIHVLAHEKMTSGAYLAAARMCAKGGKMYATPTAAVGSIGCVIMMYDTSRMHEDMGVKVIPIATGTMKAMGAPGTVITEEQQAAQQKRADDVMTAFAADVAAARGISVEAVAAMQAAVYFGEDCVKHGLVDALVDATAFEMSLRQKLGRNAVASVTTSNSGSSSETGDEPNGESVMAGEQGGESGKPIAASMKQLKDIFGTDSAAIVASVEAGHTVEQAQAARIVNLNAELAASKGAVVAAETAAANLATLPPKSGTAPVTSPAAIAGSLVTAPGGPSCVRPNDDHAFMQAANQYAQTHKCGLDAAIMAVATANPALHGEYMKSMPRGRLSERKAG